MWSGLGRIAGRTLLLSGPGIATIVILLIAGTIDSAGACTGLLATGIAASLMAVPFVLSVQNAGDAIAALGPDAPLGHERELASQARHLSPSAQALWPAVLRLRRAWREYSQRTEARLAAVEALIAALPDPLIVIDAQRRIVRANAASTALIGPAFEGRDLAAALRDPALLEAANSVLRGERGRSVEFALAGPVERVLRAHLARIDDRAYGGVTAVLALHDVTALKSAEQMRADFIANAGHELKTPLATLIGFIETLLGPARDDAAARDRFLGIMQAQSRRMARLVDDLLSLSRIELNEHLPPGGRVVLAPVIEEVARSFELRAAERQIRVTVALGGDLPAVQGDRDELSQIFQNLIDNAIKYTRPKTEVTVSAGFGKHGSSEMVWVTVADRGEGIAREHLPRLTERFYRVDTARSRELGGTGLGLAIVKHIVNRHRGRLAIESRLGDGSRFTVWLPIVAAIAPAATAA